VNASEARSEAKRGRRCQLQCNPLLEVAGLVKHYPLRGGLFSRASGAVRAVDGVSFALAPGETLGLVGESGCGKTTLARLVLRLEEPTAGALRFEGEDLLALGSRALRARRRHFQIVFQDPMSSLNPRMTVGEILAEPLAVHGVARGKAADARVLELLEQVGIPASWRQRYPHEFSGGSASASAWRARSRSARSWSSATRPSRRSTSPCRRRC
jgi:ABC-type glutathione transport system ATPase component